MVLLGILLVILVPLFLALWGITSFVANVRDRAVQRERVAGWQKAAEMSGCTFVQTGTTLNGVVDGARLVVDCFTVETGHFKRNRLTTFTRVVAVPVGGPETAPPTRLSDHECKARFPQLSFLQLTVTGGAALVMHGGVIVDPSFLVAMMHAASLLATAPGSEVRAA